MSMFDHLSADLAVDSKATKPYTFSELLTKPTCQFRPATEDNKDYAAALLKLSSKKARKNRSSSRTTTVKSIKALRQQNQLPGQRVTGSTIRLICLTALNSSLRLTGI